MLVAMTVDSYYEYFLTLLGWVISNNIWDLMTKTGVWAAPFLVHIIRLFIKVREQGDDEGNKGKLLVAWLGNAIYGSLLVMLITCVPLFNVSYASLQFNEERSQECGMSVRKPAESGMASLSSELSGKTATVPLWWVFTHTLGKGFTHGAIAAIPCKPDLRQLRFDVQHSQIESPILRQEIQQFTENCFLPARAKVKRQKIPVDAAQARDLDWIGSSLLVNTNGFYNIYRAKTPKPFWAYELPRDDALPNTGGGGYPNCQDWWINSDVGLRKRIIDTLDKDIFLQLRKAISDDLYSDGVEAVVRSVVRPVNLDMSEGIPVNIGYGEKGFDSFTNKLIKAGAALGTAATSIAAFPAFDTMRQSLPMVQGLANLAIIIAIPIVMIMGLYSIKTMITLTFIQFGLFFLSFWWELGRWLDNWLITALFHSDTGSYWNLFGFQNIQDNLIFKFVIATMFLVLPALWFSMITWAGVNAGVGLTQLLNKGSETVKNSAEKGINDLKSKAGKL